MIKNKIVELLTDENKTIVYTALEQGSAIWCTNNQRQAPTSMITECKTYTIGINPKDLSYFDFEILPLEKLIDLDDIQMIKEYTIKKGYEQGKKAFEQSFKNVRIQYNFDDVLSLSVSTITDRKGGIDDV